MKLTLKKLNTRGFSHHFLLPVIVVLAVAGIGAQVILSKAYTVKVPAQYVYAPQTQKGCWLAGRIWKSDNTCATGTVGTNTPCRVKSSVYKHMTDTDGTTRGYCTGAVALESSVSQDMCVNQLHRVFVKYIGCSRRIDQDNTNGAQQCVGNSVPSTDPLSKYKNYVADGSVDRCVAPAIATTPTTSGSTTPEDALDKTVCQQLGRVVDTATGKCKQVCQTGAGTLLVASDAAKTKYCSSSIGNGITQARCTSLHRAWTAAGCTRRPDQKDNATDLIHCVSGYPYYNADSSGGYLDVCEVNKTTSDANEAAGIIGGQVVCKGGQVLSADKKSCACPSGQSFKDGKCVTLPAPGQTDQCQDAARCTVPDNNSGGTNSGFKITVYEGKNFTGKSKTFTDAVPNFKSKVLSYKIQKGRWQLCEKANYEQCVRRWASDPRVGDSKTFDKVVSFRPVTVTTFQDADGDVVPACVDANGAPVTPTPDGTCPEGSTLTCPTGLTLKDGECKEAVVNADVYRPVDTTFKGKDGEAKCILLGREWISKGNGGHYGCSTVTCNFIKDGAPRGDVCVSYKFDQPYAVKMEQKDCTSLHRVYIAQAERCAQVPNQKDKNRTIVKADQCAGAYSTYYIYPGKKDECFKPTFFQSAKKVAKVTGGSLGNVLQVGPKAFCAAKDKTAHGDYHWDKHAKTCKKDPPAPVPAGHPAGDGDTKSGGFVATAQYCASIGRQNPVNGVCVHACLTGFTWAGYTDSHNYDVCKRTHGDLSHCDALHGSAYYVACAICVTGYHMDAGHCVKDRTSASSSVSYTNVTCSNSRLEAAGKDDDYYCFTSGQSCIRGGAFSSFASGIQTPVEYGLGRDYYVIDYSAHTRIFGVCSED